ncbi:hypothetical protein HMF8227_00344 [Saliniradius amylolyticus]|uniref:Uncharacterized protein n=1 Tax=Saliniradius amylolyticus TaxID=2183582 RepID=A0A2S2E0N8_9ALTE|nr:hypothetical protein [Saliniradius amylolyticus]AWL10850.1 hypothetical protein HMF8227_00344 [Saliniradius amylolyticus]
MLKQTLIAVAALTSLGAFAANPPQKAEEAKQEAQQKAEQAKQKGMDKAEAMKQKAKDKKAQAEQDDKS